ncbi:MAG: PIN domain-containing protein [Candidatus Limnocylindrales bacterium]
MRALVVLDTSVFVADAYSMIRRGAASTVLALAAAGVIDVVLCEEIRAELREVFEEDQLDMRSIDLIFGRYAELFSRARWLTPVPQEPHHLKVVANDEEDTMVVRVAEAIFTQATDLVAAPDKFIVSANTKHFRPGTNYAGFQFVTARELVEKLSG